MALLTTIHCLRCGKHKQVSHSASDYPKICWDCQAEEAKYEKDAHLSKLREKSLEQRVAAIEGILYDDGIRQSRQPFNPNIPIG